MQPSPSLGDRLARLSWPLQRRLAGLVYPPGTQPDDFSQPPGEAALLDPDSVSWRVFGNPVAMLVGGVAAVLLELAEPRVRTGVWEHTTFRMQPLARLQRTGYAAMLNVFGARSRAERLIGHVNRAHVRIEGVTPSGQAYRADDVELLTWVHATATFGFLEAYARCVRPVAAADRDRFYSENQESARLYGVIEPPDGEAALHSLFETMQPSLEPSAIVLEFLGIMERMPLLPWGAGPLQRLLLRAAVQCLPAWTRDRLHLDDRRWAVAGWQWALVRAVGRAADHLTCPELPAMLARQRLAGSSGARAASSSTTAS